MVLTKEEVEYLDIVLDLKLDNEDSDLLDEEERSILTSIREKLSSLK